MDNITILIIIMMVCATVLFISIYYIESKKKKDNSGKIRDPLLRSFLFYLLFVSFIIAMQYFEILDPEFNQEYWWIHIIAIVGIVGVNILYIIYHKKKTFEFILEKVKLFCEIHLDDEFLDSKQDGKWLKFYKQFPSPYNPNDIYAFTLVKLRTQRFYAFISDMFSGEILGISQDFQEKDLEQMKNSMFPKHNDKISAVARNILDKDKVPQGDSNEET